MTNFTVADAEAVVERYLTLTRLLDATKAQEKPVITFVAAQPGSGKSAVANNVKNHLNANVIPVDADEMREVLPSRLFAGLDPVRASTATQSAAGLCVRALRQRVMAERRNVVEEGTYRDAKGGAVFFENLRKSGYRLELAVLAVHPLRSLLGVFERFESYYAHGVAHPRFVNPDYHDQSIAGFSETLQRNATKFDRIRVFNREGLLLADTDTAWSRSDAISAYRREREMLTAANVADMAIGWDAVRFLADQRGAPEDSVYMRELVTRHLALHRLLRESDEALALYDAAASMQAAEMSRSTVMPTLAVNDLC